MARFAYHLTIVAVLLTLPSALPQSRPSSAPPQNATRIDAAFQKFWAADSPAKAVRFADEAVKTGVTFDEAFRRLHLGRTYTMQKTGVIHLSNRTADGIEHNYAVNIPASYDPERRYQVRFQLHGGVGGRTDNKPRGTGEIGALAGADQIYVIPYAWQDDPWWSDDQILNLNAIIDTLKRVYNVDENRVVLSGVSDGATGAYFIAMRETTAFASFLPLNGFIMVLANKELDDGRSFPSNLRNKPMFVVNGGKDRLYPTSVVEPFTTHLMSNGVAISYLPQPNGEHNTAWWPQVKDPFETFVAGHPRNPHPDTLTWEAADPAHNRAHWLVIDNFGTVPGQASEMRDVNVVHESETSLFAGTDGRMFRGSARAGSVDLQRTGNTVQATTKGVTAFTLLLSPEQFDFKQPIKVIANSREMFNGRVEPNVGTLLKWAARDNDRTMLYATELHIKLAR
jgi:hypothetical protein